MARRKKIWCSARLDPDNYWAVKQKAHELFRGNFGLALNHIIATYRSIWTDLMMDVLRAEIYDAYERAKEAKEKEMEGSG